MAEQNLFSEEAVVDMMKKEKFILVLEGDEFDMNCEVCRRNIHTTEGTIIRCPCGHFIHSVCIIGYLRANAKCPSKNCRNYEIEE